MTFAGLSNPEDRANVIAYLNTQSDSPQKLPTAPAAAIVTQAAADRFAEGKDATALAVSFARERVLKDGSIAAIQQALEDDYAATLWLALKSRADLRNAAATAAVIPASEEIRVAASMPSQTAA